MTQDGRTQGRAILLEVIRRFGSNEDRWPQEARERAAFARALLSGVQPMVPEPSPPIAGGLAGELQQAEDAYRSYLARHGSGPDYDPRIADQLARRVADLRRELERRRRREATRRTRRQAAGREWGGAVAPAGPS